MAPAGGAHGKLRRGGNPAGVLGTDPVELETVGHENRGSGKVVGHLGRQGLDPCVELLLGQFLRQLVKAGLPQTLPRPVRRLRIRAGVVSLGHRDFCFLWIVMV